MGPPVGRRERSKQEKLARITEVARALFAERDADDITTREVAERADVATGTLFLYARTKGELLLLAHNAAYEHALGQGMAAADEAGEVVEGVMAVLASVVACNRSHLGNGRTYLREMVFGDPREPHHAAAIDLSRRTEQAVADVVERLGGRSSDEAATLARVVSSVLLLSMGSPLALTQTEDEVLAEIRRQVTAVVTG